MSVNAVEVESIFQAKLCKVVFWFKQIQTHVKYLKNS